MRLFLGLIFSLLIQIVAFIIVQGSGSVVGLFAISCAMFAVPALILVLTSLGIALTLLLIFQVVELIRLIM